MFARVITAHAEGSGFEGVVRWADQELPSVRLRPGFAGYFLLTDDDTGNVLVVSLWDTRADMETVARGTSAGIHDAAEGSGGLESVTLTTYEVALSASTPS